MPPNGKNDKMLKELIDKFYLERERAKNKEQTRFYISDAGRCSRMVFFKIKKAPRRELEAQVLRTFDHGDYIHRLILNTLFSLGLVRASEINIPPQEIIAGRADAIISLNNSLYVLDIKSISGRTKKLEKPKEEDSAQLQLYLHFFKIPKGILLYVNKDTQELNEFLVNYNPNLARNLLDELSKLKVKVDSNIIPERIPTYPDDWQCQYCQFFEICGLTGGGNVNWNDFKQKIETQQLK